MDNDERQARVLELGDQTKDFLADATKDYELFGLQCQTLNPKIASIYQQAGLTVPAQKQVEILQYTQTGHGAASSEVADVLEVIGDIGLFGTIMTSLGPPAAKWLTYSGKMPADIAEKVVLSRSITLYEDAVGAARGVPNAPVTVEIDITGSDIAGYVLSGVVAGIAVGALDLTIYLVEQATRQKHLHDAIAALHPLRTAMLLSKHHTRSALDSLKNTDALMDALDGQTKTISAKALADGTNVIVNAVTKELEKAATPSSVAAELQNRDATNKSHTGDDPPYITV